MSLTAPAALSGQRVISGPVKLRSELWWRIEDGDGRRLVLAQLLPELARDEALRRRYVRDAERRAALTGACLAEIVAIGPEPDPRDTDAAPPWRLRVDPGGEPLSEILNRAPLPVDEALELVAAIAGAVGEVHQQGAVLRDLEPRHVAVTGAGIVLTDLGLARLDILSSRSASSLMLERSPYAAPEHLRATVVDKRADIYTLGAILWQALTGELPVADANAFFRERAPLPPLASLGVDAPAGLDELIAACLDDDPEGRPESARDVADALRGGGALAGATSMALALVVCQACGERLRPGLRLCLACGREAVQFTHAGPGSRRFEIRLTKASDDAVFVARLKEFFETIAEGPIPELNFITGDARVYSKAERERLHKLPAVLIADLDEATATALAERLTDDGFPVKVVEQRERPSRSGVIAAAGAAGIAAGAVAVASALPAVGVALIACGSGALVIGLIRARRRRRRKKKLPLATLRAAPAALPASDPLIARLGDLLGGDLAGDVRERVSEIALLVQRLVDYRAGRDDADLDRLTEPVEPIVALVEREVAAIAACDRALIDLDEGDLVRAIAASEARREPRDRRTELLAGLDRLRDLEDRRARRMERLLEAASLMRRIARLGLGARDSEAEHRRLVAIAEASLSD